MNLIQKAKSRFFRIVLGTISTISATLVSIIGDRGRMDLAFANTTAHVFADKVKHLLIDNVSIHPTSASAAIRLEVAGFRVSEGEAGLHKAREAFRACARLIEFYRANRPDLDAAAHIATPL